MGVQSAYGYVRVSGRGQVDKHGLPRQRQAIAGYARAHGLRIVLCFEDAGVSGTSDLSHRPGLAALLLAVERNGVKAVLIEKLDRLARDLVVQEAILRDMKAHGVELVSVAEGPDLASSDPTRTLVRQIFGGLAQYDKAMIVLKLRAAREAVRAAKGKCEGRKAIGELDSGERRAVERIRQLRRKRPGQRRMGYRRIARVLDAEGFATRTGSPWSPSTVRNVVKPVKRPRRRT